MIKVPRGVLFTAAFLLAWAGFIGLAIGVTAFLDWVFR